MKYLKYLFVGIVFGIILSKSQVISWYRIYEMFRFESFHMYGVIGSAVVIGVIITQIIKRFGIKDIHGEPIVIHAKDKGVVRYIVGGIFFGLGWAMIGACPGPMFALFGYGYYSIVVVIAGALLGTWIYGLLRDKLPH